jgi:hypothetical protein
MIRLTIVSMAPTFPLQRDVSVPALSRHAGVLRVFDEALRVAGLIGRTRGSIARLNDRQ